MEKLKIKRGDIFYIERGVKAWGSEQWSGRPGVIVSNDTNNIHSDTVEVVFCTTRVKTPLPTHVLIRGTPHISTVLCEQVMTVSVERIGNYIGKCSDAEMKEIDLSIMVSLGLATPEMKKIYAERNMVERIDLRSAEEAALRAELATYRRLYEAVVDKLVSVSARGTENGQRAL